MLHAPHASALPILGVSRHDEQLRIWSVGGVTEHACRGYNIYLYEMFCVKHIVSLYLFRMPSRKPLLYFFFLPTRQICLYQQSWKLNGELGELSLAEAVYL